MGSIRRSLLAFWGEPLLVQYLFRKLLVEVRSDELVKGIIDLTVFAPAIAGPLLRKVTLVHKIGEGCRIGPVGEAQEIVETLRGRTVRIGKGRQRRGYGGVF